MLPLATLIFFLCVAIIVAGQDWEKKITKVILLTIIALLQTALVLFDMFTMKVPKI